MDNGISWFSPSKTSGDRQNCVPVTSGGVPHASGLLEPSKVHFQFSKNRKCTSKGLPPEHCKTFVTYVGSNPQLPNPQIKRHPSFVVRLEVARFYPFKLFVGTGSPAEGSLKKTPPQRRLVQCGVNPIKSFHS